MSPCRIALQEPSRKAPNMAKVYFYYAAMNAGKSTALLQANHNYKERGMRTLLFTTSNPTSSTKAHKKCLTSVVPWYSKP